MSTSDDSFEIPVTYKGEELSFPAELLFTGYSHKIQVEVQGLIIMFEPDEESNYRVLLNEDQLRKNTKVDGALLQAIAEVLELVVKWPN